MPPLTRRSDGLPVGAVSGFCNMLFKLLRDAVGGDQPSHLAVIFDAKGTSFRNEIFEAYKANRPPPEPDLVPQFPLVREAVRAFNVACVELVNFEADDLIATYTRQAEQAGARVSIFSSDKDLMQLVSDRVEMRDTMRNSAIGPNEVREKFGVGPEKMVDLQALAGDSTDNVPGAPGIGVKTAAALLHEYGDLDNLLARASEIKQPKRREALTEFVKQIRVSKKLVQLDDRVPVPVPVGDFRMAAPEPDKLLEFLRKMEFRTFTERVAASLGANAGAVEEAKGAAEAASVAGDFSELQYELVNSRERLQAWVLRAWEKGAVAVDTETDSLDEMRAKLVGVSLAVTAGEACYIPVGHRNESETEGLFAAEPTLSEGQLPIGVALEVLRPLLEDETVLKIGHNLKFDAKVFGQYGIELRSIDDTMLMSYVLAAGRHRQKLDDLAEIYLGHKTQPITELIGKGRTRITFAQVDPKKAAHYAAEDADVALRLHHVFRRSLIDDSKSTVYETLERPLLPVLAAMERTGMRVDPKVLEKISAEFGQRARELEREIHEIAGEAFNVASPQQLGTILFEKLSLPGAKRTSKSGGYQTGAGVLEELAAQGFEIASRIVDWRHLTKLKGTYADALVQHIHPDTRRVHTSFSLAATSTGRLASMDPNLQNIPIRTEEGRRIRQAFVAAPGNVLLSLDYSQIELRVLAHVAEIESLREAFRQGMDIHAMTASEVFGVSIENMDPMVRRRAKAINFGVIYGISRFGLANQLRIPQQEAGAFIDAYFERFPGIRDYMRHTVKSARDRGYVETLFGRRVHTPNINAKGPTRGYQERAAINAPIQGSAADIIRRAMIRIPPALEQECDSAKMLLQVHDELLFEVPESRVESTCDLVRGIMERASDPAVRLSVPIVVDTGVGSSWAEAY